MNDRRITDASSHAHKRNDDPIARLHQRLDDNDTILAGLLGARVEAVRLHSETTTAIHTLTAAVSALTIATAGTVEIEADVRGSLRMLGKISNFAGLLWKPLLFLAVLVGTLWIWITGGKAP